MKILIVDDEPPARERLERLLVDLPGWEVAASCATGSEALELVGQLHPEIVLLDIQMPGMSGIEAARHLSTLASPPAVIFTTAYDRYALEAFDSQAVGYLLKPVRRRDGMWPLDSVSDCGSFRSKKWCSFAPSRNTSPLRISEARTSSRNPSRTSKPNLATLSCARTAAS